MQTIASFQVDHDLLRPGLYVSRVDHTDIVTYDLRFKTPNAGDYLAPAAAHTLEHLFATALRNGPLAGQIIYFGPMGCLTGCYLVTKGAAHKDVIAEVRRVALWAADFSGTLPGSARKECGNYRFHDLPAARREAAAYAAVLEDCTEASLAYPTPRKP